MEVDFLCEMEHLSSFEKWGGQHRKGEKEWSRKSESEKGENVNWREECGKKRNIKWTLKIYHWWMWFIKLKK